MTVNIVPYTLPPIKIRRQPLRRPWNIEPSCVLGLMPEINTKWVDYSNYGNHGTITSATLRHKGRFGPCLYLDGVNDRINCGSDVSLDITDYYTLSAWFYPTRFPYAVSHQNITSKNFNEFRLYIGMNTSKIYTYTELAGGVFNGSYTLPSTNRWYHVVITIKDGTQVLYVNSVSRAVGAKAGAITVAAANDLSIGSNAAGAVEWIQGYIDEVLLFHRFFEAWEIKALYEQGKPGGV